MTTEPAVTPTPTEAIATPDGRWRPSWMIATAAFWGLVFVAFIGVWKASQEVGLATWWRGPRSNPQPVVVQLVPLYAPMAMVIAALGRSRRIGLAGLVAAAVTIAVALGDLGTVRKLAWVELAVGVAAVVFTLASVAASRATRR
ncbi:MAG: hypothetical protein ACK5OX_17565 [Desertimonas sp.]